MKTNPKLAEKKRQQIAFRRLVKGLGADSEIREGVGLNFLEIKEWISGRMLPGMTRQNYGKIWVIDHVVPLWLFDLRNVEHCKLVWNYRNLMPLFKEDNLRKQGDLRFSVLFLARSEDCYVTQHLMKIVTSEIKKMDKYLTV